MVLRLFCLDSNVCSRKGNSAPLQMTQKISLNILDNRKCQWLYKWIPQWPTVSAVSGAYRNFEPMELFSPLLVGFLLHDEQNCYLVTTTSFWHLPNTKLKCRQLIVGNIIMKLNWFSRLQRNVILVRKKSNIVYCIVTWGCVDDIRIAVQWMTLPHFGACRKACWCFICLFTFLFLAHAPTI